MAEHGFVTTPPGPRERATPGRARAVGDPASGNRSRARTVSQDAVIVVRPWITSDGDRSTHDARSRYVERCWLGILGPSATWLLRRLNDELDAAAVRGEGRARVDLVAAAREMGLAYTPGRESPFARAIQRCVMFDVAHHTADGLAVRRRIHAVPERFLRRLPPSVAREHDRWMLGASGADNAAPHVRRVATALAEAGLSADGVEALLTHLGADATLAAAIIDDLRRAATPPSAA